MTVTFKVFLHIPMTSSSLMLLVLLSIFIWDVCNTELGLRKMWRLVEIHLHGQLYNFLRIFLFSLCVTHKSPKQNIMLRFAPCENEKVLETE